MTITLLSRDKVMRETSSGSCGNRCARLRRAHSAHRQRGVAQPRDVKVIRSATSRWSANHVRSTDWLVPDWNTMAEASGRSSAAGTRDAHAVAAERLVLDGPVIVITLSGATGLVADV